MKTNFSFLPVGSRFEFNGNLCIKKSTRTALLIEFQRVFYFSATDRVQVKGLNHE